MCGCGCMYGINVAGNLLSAGTAKRALVLVGDTAMRMGSLKDKSRMPLFGDSGTVVPVDKVSDYKKVLVAYYEDESKKDEIVSFLKNYCWIKF